MARRIEWEDRSSNNEGRPAWSWWSDEHVGDPDEWVGIYVLWGQSANGRWGVKLMLDGDGLRISPDLDEADAKERAEALVRALQVVWPETRQ